jgi:pimeloyl-ACP methyl ester carboxylesterase
MERGMGIRPAANSDGGGGTVNDPEAVATAIEALRMWDGAESALPWIQTPVLLIAGSKDPAFDAAQDSASQISSARFEMLDGVDHSGSFYNPDASLGKVRDFLKATEKTASETAKRPRDQI